MDLPGKKPLCSSEMIELKTCLSLLAMTLEIILYTVLHKDIGLKSSKVNCVAFFGTRAIKVLLKSLRMKPPALIPRPLPTILCEK